MPLVPRYVIDCSDCPSLTQQQFAADADIRNIMNQYQRTGLVNHVNKHQGLYGDYTSPPDYQTALNKVIAADEMFASLPAKLRAKFENDPAQFLSFVDDPKNGEEMITLGLRTAPGTKLEGQGDASIKSQGKTEGSKDTGEKS